MATGFATIGGIGFEGRIDYGAIGNDTKLSARLCGEAAGGETRQPGLVASGGNANTCCSASTSGNT